MATLRKSLRTIKIQPLYYFKLIKYERTSYKSKFITEWGSLSRLYKNFLLLSADCPQKSRRFVRRVPSKYAILKAQNKKARLGMAGRQFPKRMIRWGGTLLPQAVGRAMECNSSNRHLRWKQGAAVGAVADKTRTPFRREADVGCHNPGTFCVETAGRPEKLA